MKKSGIRQQLGGAPPTGPGRFMDTRHGDDFVAKAPPKSVAAWTKDTSSPPMVAAVNHITTGAHYWFLFNHAGDTVDTRSLHSNFDWGILGDPRDLERVDYVITCYPRLVKRAMEGVDGFMKKYGRRMKLNNNWATGALFNRLATKVVGLDYYGTTSIGHSNKFDPNSFWIEFTNDEAVYR